MAETGWIFPEIVNRSGIYHSMDEPNLILGTQHGDLDAFNKLVLAYQDSIFNCAQRILGDDELAADITQDAFISAFRHINTYYGGSFKAWLLRTVTNGCYDELRRRKRHPSVPLESENADEDIGNSRWLTDARLSPEENIENNEREQAIQQGLNNLPIDARTIIVLVDIQGMKYQEAASILQVPLGTIKSRLARGRLHLRGHLRKYVESLPVNNQPLNDKSI